MKKRALSLILISALSLSLFVGCRGNNNNNTTQNSNQQEENTNTTEQASTDDNDNGTESTILVEEVTDEKIETKFTDIIEYLYNRDYSNEEKAIEAENYINENFTPEGAKNMINKIISYGNNVSYSDLLITLVKKVENNDNRYESMYEVRYNISVTIDNPSIYSDIIAKVVVDNDGNIFIESINDFEF